MSRELTNAIVQLDRHVRTLPIGSTRSLLEPIVTEIIARLPDAGLHDIGDVIRRDRAGVWAAS